MLSVLRSPTGIAIGWAAFSGTHLVVVSRFAFVTGKVKIITEKYLEHILSYYKLLL